MKTKIKIELELEVELNVEDDLEFDEFVMDTENLIEELRFAASEECQVKSNYERFKKEAGYE
jgi:hypothetical protein